MTPIDQTISEFGHSMGMRDLRPNDAGAVVLDISGIGKLAIEMIGTRQEVVSISLTRRIEPPDANACRLALELTHYRQNGRWPIRAALAGGRGLLVFAARLDSNAFDLPALHDTIGQLEQLQDAMSGSVRSA